MASSKMRSPMLDTNMPGLPTLACRIFVIMAHKSARIWWVEFTERKQMRQVVDGKVKHAYNISAVGVQRMRLSKRKILRRKINNICRLKLNENMNHSLNFYQNVLYEVISLVCFYYYYHYYFHSSNKFLSCVSRTTRFILFCREQLTSVYFDVNALVRHTTG